MLIAIVSLLTNFSLTLTALVRGYRPVRYVVLGQAIAAAGTVLRMGESMGWLPFTPVSGEAILGGIAYVSALCFFAAISRRVAFSVALPLACEDEVQAESAKPAVTGYTGPARRVLILEDTPAHRHWLEHLLSGLGFKVRGAASLQEARDWIAAEAFDLALLDQWLPDGTAYDLLPELSSAVPAILITAMAPAPPPGLAPALRFAATLLKPVAGDELLETIGRMLDLAWIEADAGTTDAAGTAPPLTAMPAADSLAELRSLAKAGAVYEIEEWIDRIRRTAPECSGWLMQVEDRLAVLDFEGIVVLAEREAP
ncbi:MAG: response regulator [Methylococcaceae bacterium]|nr:MAG: response regulator [Methylococcaceae bacterium]